MGNPFRSKKHLDKASQEKERQEALEDFQRRYNIFFPRYKKLAQECQVDWAGILNPPDPFKGITPGIAAVDMKGKYENKEDAIIKPSKGDIIKGAS